MRTNWKKAPHLTDLIDFSPICEKNFFNDDVLECKFSILWCLNWLLISPRVKFWRWCAPFWCLPHRPSCFTALPSHAMNRSVNSTAQRLASGVVLLGGEFYGHKFVQKAVDIAIAVFERTFDSRSMRFRQSLAYARFWSFGSHLNSARTWPTGTRTEQNSRTIKPTWETCPKSFFFCRKSHSKSYPYTCLSYYSKHFLQEKYLACASQDFNNLEISVRSYLLSRITMTRESGRSKPKACTWRFE